MTDKNGLTRAPPLLLPSLPLGLEKPEGLLDDDAQHDFEPIIAVLDQWKADAAPERDKV